MLKRRTDIRRNALQLLRPLADQRVGKPSNQIRLQAASLFRQPGRCRLS
jgi:hypothetical protein